MSRPIFTSLAPNQEPDDTRLAWRILSSPANYMTGPDLAEAQATLSAQLDITSHVTPNQLWLHSSGRSALMSLLTVFRNTYTLPADSEVLMQSYTCNAVPNPVLWAGFQPVYVDIDYTTGMMTAETLRQKITPRSTVLIIQHTLGHVAPLTELLAVAREHDLFVIEDCAHALGAYYDNAPIGTFGDAAIFSFGRDKVISSVYGGAALLNTASRYWEKLHTPIDEHYATLPSPSRGWVIQQLMHLIIFSVAIPLYRTLSIGKILIELSKRLHIISLAIQVGERTGQRPSPIPSRLPNALARLVTHQLNKLSKFQNHRRARAEQYAHGLAGLPLTPLPTQPDPLEQPSYLRYTVLTSEAVALIAYCANHGIYLGDWYRSVIAPDYTDLPAMHYTAGSCPTAEQLATQTVNLPTHINITPEDTDRIIATVTDFFTHHTRTT